MLKLRLRVDLLIYLSIFGININQNLELLKKQKVISNESKTLF